MHKTDIYKFSIYKQIFRTYFFYRIKKKIYIYITYIYITYLRNIFNLKNIIYNKFKYIFKYIFRIGEEKNYITQSEKFMKARRKIFTEFKFYAYQ